MQILRFETKDRVTQSVYVYCIGRYHGAGYGSVVKYLNVYVWNVIEAIIVPVKEDIKASIDTEDGW